MSGIEYCCDCKSLQDRFPGMRCSPCETAYREGVTEGRMLHLRSALGADDEPTYWCTADAAKLERLFVINWLRRGDECCVANAERILNCDHLKLAP